MTISGIEQVCAKLHGSVIKYVRARTQSPELLLLMYAVHELQIQFDALWPAIFAPLPPDWPPDYHEIYCLVSQQNEVGLDRRLDDAYGFSCHGVVQVRIFA